MHSIFKKALSATFVVLTLASTSGLAMAYSRWAPARINARQNCQTQRIFNGFQNGRLTRGEAQRLWVAENRINRMENRFRSDGYLSSKERLRLQQALNHQNRAIYQQAYDWQRR